MIGICRFLAIVCLATYLSVLQINGQTPCAPLGVVNISISYDAVVSWDSHPNETCEISYFLVYVDSDTGTEYVYAVSRTSLAVNFLPVCDDYVFRVVPISTNNVEGEEISLATKIPLPENANLTVGMVKVSQGEGHWVHLEWSMDDDWLKCADRFRVIINDEDIDHLQDIYTFNTSVSIPNIAPCTSYEFGVVAIYNWAIEGPVTVVRHATPEGVLRPPRLSNIAVQTTSANLTWTLENFAFNKCPVTKAEVTVVNRYNVTVDILDQTVRQPFSVILPNLSADSIFIVNVTVINSAGPSPPVTVAIQTAGS